MYGTYWCPSCDKQKEIFGSAASLITEVECDPRGKNAQPEVCNVQGIHAYPSWVINGKVYRGFQSLGQLATISGYEG